MQILNKNLTEGFIHLWKWKKDFGMYHTKAILKRNPDTHVSLNACLHVFPIIFAYDSVIKESIHMKP